jgi:hypothetical protein
VLLGVWGATEQPTNLSGFLEKWAWFEAALHAQVTRQAEENWTLNEQPRRKERGIRPERDSTNPLFLPEITVSRQRAPQNAWFEKTNVSPNRHLDLTH